MKKFMRYIGLALMLGYGMAPLNAMEIAAVDAVDAAADAADTNVLKEVNVEAPPALPSTPPPPLPRLPETPPVDADVSPGTQQPEDVKRPTVIQKAQAQGQKAIDQAKNVLTEGKDVLNEGKVAAAKANAQANEVVGSAREAAGNAQSIIDHLKSGKKIEETPEAKAARVEKEAQDEKEVTQLTEDAIANQKEIDALIAKQKTVDGLTPTEKKNLVQLQARKVLLQGQIGAKAATKTLRNTVAAAIIGTGVVIEGINAVKPIYETIHNARGGSSNSSSNQNNQSAQTGNTQNQGGGTTSSDDSGDTTTPKKKKKKKKKKTKKNQDQAYEEAFSRNQASRNTGTPDRSAQNRTALDRIEAQDDLKEQGGDVLAQEEDQEIAETERKSNVTKKEPKKVTRKAKVVDEEDAQDTVGGYVGGDE